MVNIKYEWSFGAPEVLLSADGLSNVVKNIPWTIIATVDDETLDKNPYRAVYNHTTSFSGVEPDNFVPFEHLTEAQVISWIESIENIEQVKEWLASQIEEQMNPKTAVIDFPFVNKEINP